MQHFVLTIYYEMFTFLNKKTRTPDARNYTDLTSSKIPYIAYEDQNIRK